MIRQDRTKKASFRPAKMAIGVRLYCVANEGMLDMARRQATRR